MSQPTVNAVTDLNPNAQQFFSHDSQQQQRTVLTDVSTPPSDISTPADMENRSAAYFPAYAYPATPTALDSQTPSADPSPSNSNQSSLPDKSQLSPEQIRQKLRSQLEYYFSKANLINDIYLQSRMDADNYVPISLLIDFKLVKRLTDDLQLVVDVLKEIASVEVDADEKRVRSSDPNTYLNQRKRCIIILRNVPVDATESEVSEIFQREKCSVAGAIEYERVLESNHTDCWYVTFASEDDAQHAFLYLTRESVSIRDQKILARMKTRLWQKPSAVPERKPSPVPPELTEERKATSTPSQQRYTLVYLQPTMASHGNPQTPHYRPAPPVFQSPYFPGNYNAYLPYDRLAWANAVHQQNLNSYPNAVHPMVANHQAFPSSYWYIPSTADPTVVPLQSLFRTYNGGTRPKSRTMREYSSTSKAQNSVKGSPSETARLDEGPSNHETASLSASLDISTSPVSDPSRPTALDDNLSSTSGANVSTAISSNQTSALDGVNPRSYADTLKFKQISDGTDAVANALPLEQLTINDTSTGNGARDRHRNKRGNTRFYHRSRDDPSQQSTVHRAPE